jgi:hypothetical protein
MPAVLRNGSPAGVFAVPAESAAAHGVSKSKHSVAAGRMCLERTDLAIIIPRPPADLNEWKRPKVISAEYMSHVISSELVFSFKGSEFRQHVE